MGWREFIAELAKATAWPITIILILWLLREKLGDVIPRLLKVKHGETEIEFSKTMDQIEDKAIALPLDIDSTDDISKESERLKRLATIVPKAAIQQAWNALDRHITDLLIGRDVKPIGRSIKTSQVTAELKRMGLSNEDLSSLKQLRSIRNLTAHDRPLDFPEEKID